MTTKTFTAPGTGPVAFDLDASFVYAEITVSSDAAAASAELSGPAEVIDGTRVSGLDTDRRWGLTLPRTPSTGGSVVVQSTGDMIISSVIGSVSAGRVIVNGVDVAAAVSAAAPEPVRLVVTLPAGSALTAEIGAGRLTVRGELPAVSVTATSADVNLDTIAGPQVGARVRTVSGDITARTVASSAHLRSVSGDIDVDAAAGPVTAQTTSGDITVHAAAPVTVDAASVSGDIRVTAGPGICPDVRARSVSGRVRTPGGAR